MGLVLTSGRDDGSVGRDDNWPFELSLQVIDDLLADFVVSSEGSEGSSNQDVLALSSVILSEFNILSRADVELLEMSLDVSVALLEVLKSLGNVFFEFSYLDL